MSTAQLFDLTGRVGLVTGGGQGLGAAIAEALHGQGATTFVLDHNIDAAVATARQMANRSGSGPAAEALECDVRDRQQISSCVATILAQHRRIDVLVNNAGIHRRVDPLDASPDDIEAVLEINLVGSFQMASAVGQVMIEQRSGSIINLSALGGGLVGLGRGGSIYGATKGGIVALTRDLAAEWGKYGVRVNALAPGWIRTPMTAALQHDRQKAAKVLERVPLGRWGEASDVAGAAVYLASDASQYVTGHTIPIDGGAANVIALSDE